MHINHTHAIKHWLKNISYLKNLCFYYLFNLFFSLFRRNVISPRISIIIPCKDSARFLPSLFNILRQQKFKLFEVIFVNDGSTDGTAEMLKDFQQSDSRARIITLPENKGAGYARNIALPHIRGQYTIFLDADDIYYPEMLQKVYLKALRTDADITMFHSVCYDDQSEQFSKKDIKWLWNKPYPDHQIFGPEQVRDNLFIFCRGVLWNKLYKTELIKRHNLCFLNVKRHNDSYFVYTSYVVASKMYVMNKTLIAYRINNQQSITRAAVEAGAEGREKTYLALKQFLQQHHSLEKYAHALQQYKELG